MKFTHHFSFLITLYVSIICIPSVSWGEPDFCVNGCGGSTNICEVFNVVDNTTGHINVYVESDFANEMMNCTPDTDDDDYLQYSSGETRLRNAVNSVLEIWNSQTRSPFLVYAGTFTQSDPISACTSSSYKQPALFISFVEGCFEEPDGTCTTTTGAITSNVDLNTCPYSTQILFYGDRQTPGSCGSTSRDYTFTKNQWDQRFTLNLKNPSHFKSLLSHEIGHALRLLHPNDDGTDQTGSKSIMLSSQYNSDFKYRHPYYYEKDCVDDLNSGYRNPHSRYLGFSYNNSTYGDYAMSSSLPTNSKGSLSGGFWVDDAVSTSENYPYNHVNTATGSSDFWMSFGGGTNGYFSFSDYGDWTVGAINSNPVTLTTLEHSSGSKQRINYNWAGSSMSYADPPVLRYARSDNEFSSATYFTYEECISGTCTDMNSHIPMTAAWDPITSQTLFARVDTDRNSSSEGSIFIHPGFTSSSSYYQLNAGAKANTGVTNWPSESFTHHDYKGETEMAVGIACAPQAISNDHNCIIAWAERETLDARLLYRYFHIDSGTNVVDFHSTVFARSGAYTVGHVSAAYFNDSLWLSWKDSTTKSDVRYCESQNLTSLGSWKTPINVTNSSFVYTFDPPTFGYVSNASSTSEAVLMWTEKNVSSSL